MVSDNCLNAVEWLQQMTICMATPQARAAWSKSNIDFNNPNLLFGLDVHQCQSSKVEECSSRVPVIFNTGETRNGTGNEQFATENLFDAA